MRLSNTTLEAKCRARDVQSWEDIIAEYLRREQHVGQWTEEICPFPSTPEVSGITQSLRAA